MLYLDMKRIYFFLRKHFSVDDFAEIEILLQYKNISNDGWITQLIYL